MGLRQAQLSATLGVPFRKARCLNPYGRRCRQPMASWPGVATEGPSSRSLGASGASVPEAVLEEEAESAAAAGASGRSSALAEAAVEDRAEAVAQRRRRREACFVYCHRVFSHRDAVVRELIRLKMIGAVERQF